MTCQHAWLLIDSAARGLAAEINDRAGVARDQAAGIEEDFAHLRGEAHAGDLSAYRTPAVELPGLHHATRPTAQARRPDGRRVRA